MRKSVLLLASLALAALSLTTLMTPAVQAAVYSDYARQDDYYFWFIHNYWELWLKVDTNADTLWIKWNAEDWFWGGHYFYFGSYIHVWDDDGKIYWFDAPPMYHISPDGEKTFTYTKNYKWVHVEVRWVYMVTPFLGYAVTLRCDTYVGP
jgi:hypothetical protein